jgi:hypothetical protein
MNRKPDVHRFFPRPNRRPTIPPRHEYQKLAPEPLKEVLVMTRRADPERIFQARRAAVRYALMDTGMSLETANRCCDA